MKSKKRAVETVTKTAMPFCKHLPPELTTPMGQVMVDWAFYEMRLHELVYLALNINLAQGRLSIRPMPAPNLYETAIDLFALEGIALPKQNSDVKKELARRRNLLAHGVWFHDGEHYFLRDLTGTSSDGNQKIKGKILPKGIPMTADAIIDLSTAIQQATSDIESLIQAVTERRSSLQRKHLE